MAGKIVVFGATGYTGRRTARALVDRGLRPVLAARSTERAAALAEELGGLEIARADSADPPSVQSLVEPGDVLVSAVGPFARRGRPAVDAAIAVGARYLDSSGEPTFVRAVFERAAPLAERTGASLIPAFGFDYVPGNLAAALALRDAGDEAVRVDVGYFVDGDVLRGASRGTRASAVGMFLESSFEFRDGRVKADAPVRARRFDVAGRAREAMSLGGSEHYGLPRVHPSLREVNVYLGSGGAARIAPLVGGFRSLVGALPGARGLAGGLSEAMAARPDDPGPDRPGLRAHVVAVAAGADGRTLAETVVRVGDVYGFTAGILAWGAERCLTADMAPGALGPVDAFGLAELAAGCAESDAVAEESPKTE
ncbi:MAG TPA: saccharopine dehydrogenase NADP-binding domain-containing protein [Streptosporangiaceae bacterium]|jgi:putative NADH-flavin reductase